MEALEVKTRAARKGWIETTLGDACELIMGQSPPSSAYNDAGKGLPFFQGKTEFGDLHPTPVKWCTTPTKRAIAGDVLLSVRAPVGPTNLADQECCIGRGLSAVRPLNGTLSRYVLYYLRSIATDIDALGTGTTFKAVSGKVLRDVPFPLAPLPEQRRIVEAIELQLGRLDAAVSRLQAAKAKLKRYKQAVLNEYVHVDDADECTLEEAVDRVQIGPFGSQLHKADYISGGIPLINPQHIVDMRIEPDDALTLSKAKYAELSNYHLREGDVILGRRGEMGRCAVITEVEDGWFCGTGSLFVRPGAKVDSQFLAFFLSSPSSVAYLEGSSIGTTMSNLNKAILLGMPIRLPEIKEQRRLVKLIEEALDKSGSTDSTLDAQLLQATRLRQAVLKRAFEGSLV